MTYPHAIPYHHHGLPGYYPYHEPRPTILTAFLFVPVILTALLSYSYAHLSALPLSPRRRQQIVTFHAFAIEGVQIVLAVLGLVDLLTVCVEEYHAMLILRTYGVDKGWDWGHVVVGSFNVLVLHGCAVKTVDLVEGWVGGRGWVCPYGGRCFVLTRFVVGRVVEGWSPTIGMGGKGVDGGTAGASTSRPVKRSDAVHGLGSEATRRLERRVEGRLACLDLAVDNIMLSRRHLRSWPARRPSAARNAQTTGACEHLDLAVGGSRLRPASQPSRPTYVDETGKPEAKIVQEKAAAESIRAEAVQGAVTLLPTPPHSEKRVSQKGVSVGVSLEVSTEETETEKKVEEACEDEVKALAVEKGNAERVSVKDFVAWLEQVR